MFDRTVTRNAKTNVKLQNLEIPNSASLEKWGGSALQSDTLGVIQC